MNKLGRSNHPKPRAPRGKVRFNKWTQDRRHLDAARALRRRGAKHYSSFVIPVSPDTQSVVMVKDVEDCYFCGQPIPPEDLKANFHELCGEKLLSDLIPPPKWKFPGGGPDPEDGAIGAEYNSKELVLAMRKTAMREITEETGLVVLESNLLYIHYVQKKPWHAWVGFVGLVPELDPVILAKHKCHEIQEIGIFNLEELRHLVHEGDSSSENQDIYEAHAQAAEKFLTEVVPYMEEWTGQVA